VSRRRERNLPGRPRRTLLGERSRRRVLVLRPTHLMPRGSMISMVGPTRRLSLIGLTALVATLACSGGSGPADAGTGGKAGGRGDAAAGTDGAAGAGGQGDGGAGGGSGGAAGGGPCATDSDYAFHTEAGCCGMCLAKTDVVPPRIPCGANCGAPPSYLCIEGRCREGNLTSGSSCDLARSECGRNLICCRLCSPVGEGCDSPRCATPMTFSGLPMCPQPA
jgi:hypothetical protein